MASILPALILCVAGVVILLVGMFVRTGMLTIASVISLFGIALGFLTNTPLRRLNQTAFAGLVAMDAFSWFLNIMILIAAALTVLISLRYLADEETDLYEYFVLILFASAGMMFMVSANHILVLFIGLETLSISIYVLVGLRPGSAESKEAALKYLLLGGFSSGIRLEYKGVWTSIAMFGATR